MRGTALLLLLLAGCAGMDGVGCSRANWYDLGYRDAIFGILPQDDLYAQNCERHGVKVDVTRYRQGFREGMYEADIRRAGSHD
jgi:Protein of unknown function (DUF2799)